MKEPFYDFKKIEDRFTFEFDSISDAKTVRKIIEFRLINSEISLYNLALVDILPDGTASVIN